MPAPLRSGQEAPAVIPGEAPDRMLVIDRVSQSPRPARRRVVIAEPHAP